MTDTPCILWTGYTDRGGYGRIRAWGRDESTHRAMYRLVYGSIPAGKELHHVCETPACVNPLHLMPLTRAEHSKFSKKAQQTHCKHGHPFDEDNTYVDPNGNRDCRACGRDRARRYYRRQNGRVA